VNAHENYSECVQAGIGNRSIREDVKAQSLLGVEGFAEGLRRLVTEKQQIREIPKGQRFVGRPSADGYSQIKVASFLRPPLFDDQPNPHSREKSNSKDLIPTAHLMGCPSPSGRAGSDRLRSCRVFVPKDRVF
jgi:hypothetical protein